MKFVLWGIKTWSLAYKHWQALKLSFNCFESFYSCVTLSDKLYFSFFLRFSKSPQKVCCVVSNYCPAVNFLPSFFCWLRTFCLNRFLLVDFRKTDNFHFLLNGCDDLEMGQADNEVFNYRYKFKINYCVLVVIFSLKKQHPLCHMTTIGWPVFKKKFSIFVCQHLYLLIYKKTTACEMLSRFDNVTTHTEIL